MTPREKLDQAITEYVTSLGFEDPILSVNWVLGHEVITYSPIDGHGDLGYAIDYASSDGSTMSGSIGISQAIARMILDDSTERDDDEA